jgi:GTP diphosphokinase / guanosine-3',5'-bis(diphosphate) 3'-diphosphatase
MNSELGSPLQTTLRAFRYAALKHREQKMADGVTPYFSHVVRVTWILRDLFGVHDQDVIIATILHDVVEDTPTTEAEIAAEFGATAARYVGLLTKDESLPKKRREREYDEKLKNAPEIVKVAKLADIYDNLSSRIGTAKLANTLANARRITDSFAQTMAGARGLQALAHVQQLIAEVEAVAPRRSASRSRSRPRLRRPVEHSPSTPVFAAEASNNNRAERTPSVESPNGSRPWFERFTRKAGGG